MLPRFRQERIIKSSEKLPDLLHLYHFMTMAQQLVSRITLIVFGLIPALLFGQDVVSYQQEIQNWDKSRAAYLLSEEGWLNLEGLFWLKEGKNSFGSSKKNEIVFPPAIRQEFAGYFERSGDTVKLIPTGGSEIMVNGIKSGEAIVFHTDLSAAPLMSCGSLRWTIIKREDKIGIRLRDLNSSNLKSFKGIGRFPVDAEWKREAVLVRGNPFQTVLITNVLGQTTEQRSPGKLIFTLQGKEYSLDALEEGNQLFIIFGDETSGETTYPSGRYLYAPKPGPDGKTVLDFNKAYNPPCAFTPHATCPIPPQQNILSIAVTAGEKNYH